MISEESQKKIQEIMDGLTGAGRAPNKIEELEEIRKVCKSGKMKEVRLTIIDILLVRDTGERILMDIKSAKPNIGEFKGFKRTLLEWAAVEMAANQDAQLKTMIGIPYNPYEPEQYNRWTIRGMLDLKEEILVAGELWDFIGGAGAYSDLLACFEQVGIALRPEIDHHFSEFK